MSMCMRCAFGPAKAAGRLHINYIYITYNIHVYIIHHSTRREERLFRSTYQYQEGVIYVYGELLRSGAKGQEVEEAETELRRLKQMDASRRELLQRAKAAQEVGREDRLRQCVEEAEKQNLVQVGEDV